MTSISHSAILAFLVFVELFFFFQCRDKNGDLWRVDSIAPCAFITSLQETWNIRGQVEDYGYFLSADYLFFIFVNRHHSLNQEVVGLSVNRDHNIWTMQRKKNVLCHRHQAVHDQYFNCNIIFYH